VKKLNAVIEIINRDISSLESQLIAARMALKYVEGLMKNEPKGLSALFEKHPNQELPDTTRLSSDEKSKYRHVCPKCKKILVNFHEQLDCPACIRTPMITNLIISHPKKRV